MNTKGIIWIVVILIVLVVVGGVLWYVSSNEETNTNVASNINTVTNGITNIGAEPVRSVEPLFVFSVEPVSGSQAGGDTIKITGQNFIDGAKVYLNDVSATGITFISETELTAITPSGAPGEAKIKVSNPDGVSGTLSNGFTYE